MTAGRELLFWWAVMVKLPQNHFVLPGQCGHIPHNIVADGLWYHTQYTNINHLKKEDIKSIMIYIGSGGNFLKVTLLTK